MKPNDVTRPYRRPHRIRKMYRIPSSISELSGLSQTHKTGEVWANLVVSHLLARTPYSFVQEFNAESEVCVDELVHRLVPRIGFEEILSFPSAMRERVMAVTGVTFALWTRRTSGTVDAYSTRTCGKLIQVVKISKEENMSVKLDTVLLKWYWMEYGCQGVAMRLNTEGFCLSSFLGLFRFNGTEWEQERNQRVHGDNAVK